MNDDRVYNVLFVCAHNAARSLMAEAILNREGKGHFRGYSAGSQPRTEIHPYALELLQKMHLDTSVLRPKSWSAFIESAPPPIDFAFTLCDKTAAEPTPNWPGQPLAIDWSIPDPALVEGNEAQRSLAYAETFRMITNRISVFVNLPFERLNHMSLKEQLIHIGRL
ncbi:protein tyrosine phosphatase [Magnetococcus marinus MC-1]|uniref:Protein tyrosine phosphatase n=1 Tax=Magnetococcus marinus (strain ATCC BAA-1437 / JCM 17883 / MC-1) TaxID=156889 RepID=A0LBW4_MAGMM|nr:arsenate reductase ArsC [Magnetococcus marinus]ABK45457.1 protein tyrosine phosphatase [Magnetococcus marinus MC-1]